MKNTHDPVAKWLADRMAAGWFLHADGAGLPARFLLQHQWGQVGASFGPNSGPVIGVLHSLVCEAWGDKYVTTIVGPLEAAVEISRMGEGSLFRFEADTLREALVQALYAAP